MSDEPVITKNINITIRTDRPKISREKDEIEI